LEKVSNVNEILSQLKREFNCLNYNELASILGTSRTNIDSWVRRKSIPAKWLLKIEQLRQNLSNNQYKNPDTSLSFVKEQISELEKNQLPHNNRQKFVAKSNTGEILVEVLSLKASAGVGIENFEVEKIGQLVLPIVFFKTKPNPKNLKIIQAVGDSMEPTIQNEAWVVIDTSLKGGVDGIYAVVINEHIVIKRLQFNLDGTIEVISDNPKYKRQLFDPKESDNLFILGKKVLVIQ